MTYKYILPLHCEHNSFMTNSNLIMKSYSMCFCGINQGVMVSYCGIIKMLSIIKGFSKG